ncbi:hypothetical protein GBAR_LOCUS14455 [Geodia barretti]|uniref:Ig-like domain-containing protein n=1 Tax=Geodia barretti TaxID=519541 RepID=A0AA35S973_GEOBA|nr:hypothetical protein GBAR_LOCUS14455 [Geodia barretti]
MKWFPVWYPVSACVAQSTAGVISAVLALTCTTFTGCQAVCDTYGSRPMAVIGEKFTLQCTIHCFSLQYKWISVTESANITLENETRDMLNVSSNVTSVGEVGGKLYECQCVSGGCLLFRIGVKPVGHLLFSTNTTKTGGTVNITCKADGYPSYFSFEVTHENNQIRTITLPGRRGVYFVIESASKNDSGEYACYPEATLQEYPNDPLQGNAAKFRLTVYGELNSFSN